MEINDYEKLIQLHKHSDSSDLNGLLKDMKKAGFRPSIYCRGKLWRAHVNCAGNYWHDGKTPASSMRGAIKLAIKSFNTLKRDNRINID